MSETHAETFTSATGLVLPHLDEHGTCDCECPSCTLPADAENWGLRCICPDCNVRLCGMHPIEVSS